MKNIAIIPARGGSKRIPRKNIKAFLGKPIIAYSIQAALNSKLFDRVMVSTEDQEIAQISKQYGAEVPFMRSEKTADDFATTVEVLLEVISEYKSRGEEFDAICCIYPCAPFVTPDLLHKGHKKLKEFDSVVPIVPFDFPIQRAFRLENERVRCFYPEHEKTRSQDLETAYHDAGQFYWIKQKVVSEKKTLIPQYTGFVILESNLVQDIDVIEDWELAELKYSTFCNHEL